MPSNAQWDEMSKAADLAHFSPATTTSLADNTFTLAYSQNYFSVHLITLSNPDAVSVKKPAEKNSVATAKTLRPHIGNNGMVLEMPLSGRYTASLFTINGRKVFEASGQGPGNLAIPVPRVSRGAFVLQG